MRRTESSQVFNDSLNSDKTPEAPYLQSACCGQQRSLLPKPLLVGTKIQDPLVFLLPGPNLL